MKGQPLRLVRRGDRDGANRGDTDRGAGAGDPSPSPVTHPVAALQAEQLQARVRARLMELDPGLARRVAWERFDPESGRADAVVTSATPGGGQQSVDVWLLCSRAVIWVLTVAYLADAGNFRELDRQRFDDPTSAARAFRAAVQAG